ncbi:MAG: ABC transporter permease [Caldilineaceae bacterium]
MRKLWAIASRNLYTTFSDRYLLLIMFVTPVALSTIIGLAFGGLSGDTPTFANIPVAIVNLDEGFSLQTMIDDAPAGQTPLTATTFVSGTNLLAGTSDVSFNFGKQLAAILASTPLTATNFVSGTGVANNNFDPANFTCDLLPKDETADNAFQGSLSDLLTATVLTDSVAARTAVARGEYAVAVIISPTFTSELMPVFGRNPVTATTVVSGLVSGSAGAAVEVLGNSGSPLAANIVHSIVQGITSQFLRLPVTLETAVDTLTEDLDLTLVNPQTLSTTLTTLDPNTFSVLGCLFMPGINPIRAQQQPLDKLQADEPFARILVVVGSAQAVFFALFTGVFGILGIYDERRQGTLQRMLVSPTPKLLILLGKLVGNLLVVAVQLALLMLALTVVASLVLGAPLFIWGNNILAWLAILAALALCTSGVGVFLVGVARTPEQVRLVGPMVNMALGVLGGAFGFQLPEAFSRLSLIYWGVDALERLAGGQGGVGLPLLVLWGEGLVLFLVGAWFFKRRMERT